MKFTISRKDIIDVLSKIQGLTGHKTSLSITEAVLITTLDDRIALTVTDLETGFEGTYPAEIESGGSIAINARKIYEIVKNFPVDNIVIEETENNWVTIGDGQVYYNIVCMLSDDFPNSPGIKDIGFLNIDANSFKIMINRSLVIGDAGDPRAHKRGVLFEIVSNIAKMVSTDGGRLSVVSCAFGSEIPPNLITPAKVLIPKKALSEVAKFLEEGTVQVGIDANNFIVKKDREIFIVRLLEGEFPDYNEILTKSEDNKEISFDRKQFLMMLKRMSILSSDDYKSTVFNFTEDKLTIINTNPDIGESREEMAIEYNDDPIELAFNSKYFIEALQVINSESVNVRIGSEVTPCLVEGVDDKSFLSAIMPMNRN
ncbi:MAG: DNA polymerase III subunit beta [Nanoarchaeota archaeon]